MLRCIVGFSYDKCAKLSYIIGTGVTDLSDTKSDANILHVAVSLFFIGIFRLIVIKRGYSLIYW